MFHQSEELRYEIRVEEPDPEFAKILQQAIGGAEGEMRVALQYMFQAFAVPQEKAEFRTMLMETAAEKLGHIEMLATAVSKNLRDAPEEDREQVRDDPIIATMMDSGQPRQAVSAGLHAMPVDSNGVPSVLSAQSARANLTATEPMEVTIVRRLNPE